MAKLSLNARVASKALPNDIARRQKPTCDNCERYNHKRYAEVSFRVYDIFNDKPMDVLHLCHDCVWQRGEPWKGYFPCEDCWRVLVENHNWIRYQVGYRAARLCRRCMAERHFNNCDNWIDPKLVRQIVLIPCTLWLKSKKVPPLDPATGILNIARCRPVLGVNQSLPEGIKLHDDVEFDASDGQQICGRPLLDVIRALEQPFCPVPDAGYQFSVSIGIYVLDSAKELEGRA